MQSTTLSREARIQTTTLQRPVPHGEGERDAHLGPQAVETNTAPAGTPLPVCSRLALALLVAATCGAATPPSPYAVAIETPDRGAVQERVIVALTPNAVIDRKALAQIWSESPSTLDALARSASAARPPVRRLIERARDGAWPDGEAMPESWRQLTQNASLAPFLLANLRLAIARELTRRDRLEQALAVLDEAPIEQLVDPASYYFIRAVCCYRLHRREEAMLAAETLARVTAAPRRYLDIAEKIRVSLEQLRREALDGIAHDMRDLRRQLELGRVGEGTRHLGDDVVTRLDQLIKDLEEQTQQASGSPSGSKPSQPAQESRIAGGPAGDGKAANREFKGAQKWGNLPAKERARALQDIGRQFPAHYRDAIETYFRKLAESEGM